MVDAKKVAAVIREDISSIVEASTQSILGAIDKANKANTECDGDSESAVKVALDNIQSMLAVQAAELLKADKAVIPDKIGWSEVVRMKPKQRIVPNAVSTGPASGDDDSQRKAQPKTPSKPTV